MTKMSTQELQRVQGGGIIRVVWEHEGMGLSLNLYVGRRKITTLKRIDT